MSITQLDELDTPSERERTEVISCQNLVLAIRAIEEGAPVILEDEKDLLQGCMLPKPYHDLSLLNGFGTGASSPGRNIFIGQTNGLRFLLGGASDPEILRCTTGTVCKTVLCGARMMALLQAESDAGSSDEFVKK